MGMGKIAKGPRVTTLDFAGTGALELTIVRRVGLAAAPQVTTRRVNGIPLPSLPVDGPKPGSRLEITSHGHVIYLRHFAAPEHIEAYRRDRAMWTHLPFGYEQVFVTLIPAFHGADLISAISPNGPWLQHSLL